MDEWVNNNLDPILTHTVDIDQQLITKPSKKKCLVKANFIIERDILSNRNLDKTQQNIVEKSLHSDEGPLYEKIPVNGGLLCDSRRYCFQTCYIR